MAKPDQLNVKSKLKDSPEKRATSVTARATLTFDLPDGDERLELAVQGHKWRQLVRDLASTLRYWRDISDNPLEANAFRSANLIMEDYMADLGLSICTPEFIETQRQERLERYWADRDKKLKAVGGETQGVPGDN